MPSFNQVSVFLLLLLAISSIALAASSFSFPLFELRLKDFNDSLLEQFINRIHVYTPILEKTIYHLEEFYECQDLVSAFTALKYTVVTSIVCGSIALLGLLTKLVFGGNHSGSSEISTAADNDGYLAVPTNELDAVTANPPAEEEHMENTSHATANTCIRKWSGVVACSSFFLLAFTLGVANGVLYFMYNHSWCARTKKDSIVTNGSVFAFRSAEECNPFDGCVHSFQQMGFDRGNGYYFVFSALCCTAASLTIYAVSFMLTGLKRYQERRTEHLINNANTAPPALALVSNGQI